MAGGLYLVMAPGLALALALVVLNVLDTEQHFRLLLRGRRQSLLPLTRWP